MLNRFQQDVLDYLESTATHFISTLTDDSSGLIIVDELVPKLTNYLGSMIKRDLALHAEKSEGYNRLEDMLIEIHIKPNRDFSAALVKQALKPVRRRKL